MLVVNTFQLHLCVTFDFESVIIIYVFPCCNVEYEHPKNIRLINCKWSEVFKYWQKLKKGCLHTNVITQIFI